MALNIRALKHDFRFRTGFLIANSKIVDIEVKINANELMTLSIKLAPPNDLDISFKDDIDLKIGYDDSDVPPISSPYPTLSQALGSSGANVQTLQKLLKEHGYFTIATNTTFGPTTDSAVRAFQTSNGLTSDGIVGTNTWNALFKNSSYYSLDFGKFYIDSFRKRNEFFIADAINYDFAGKSNAPVSYSGQTFNAVVSSIASDFGFGTVLTSGSTYIVGTSATTGGPCIHTGTSKLDALFKLGTLYGHSNFIFSGKVYSWFYSNFWSDPEVPLVLDTELLDLERSQTTVDTTRVLDSVQWRLPSPGVFTPSTFTNVEYGDTTDLRSEGYYENSTAAFARLQGFAIIATSQIKSLKIKTYGRLGAAWLPGRVISVGNQDGTSSKWVIRNVTHNYGSNGFTSSFDLQSLNITS